MKKPVIAMLIVLFLSTLACSLQGTSYETIEPQIIFIDEDLPQTEQIAELVFKMSGGKFIITPGADGLVNGTIKFNVEQFAPQFVRKDGYFEIKPSKPIHIKTFPFKEYENTWELGITKNIPLKLTVEGGASENNFDFSGLKLTNLDISQGASETKIYFNQPNLEVIESFSLKTGASSTKIFGLGNANIKFLSVSSGAGDYTLDFSGNLSQDMDVNIKAGVSNFTIIIPPETLAVIHNNGAVTNINTKGTWLVSDNTYSTLNEGFLLTINLNMGVGNVNLYHEK